MQAVGEVDQTVNGGQWIFIAAKQFYAGHPGSVTVSNEGTKPGTLTVFDQVRFTWSGKDCLEVDANPRHAEIRMTVDFQNVANRLPEFGSALKAKLAVLASVPENALRLIGLRSGSIIAEFLVLPSVVDHPLGAGASPQRTIEYLHDAIRKNASELCLLTGGPSEGCNVELKDLGFALPSVKPLDVKTHGATLEPYWSLQCPAKTSRTFYHDGLQKDRRAEATFHFDPPQDGCYLIEEMHPQLDCGASANTKVHVNYCKGMQAVGEVDQTVNGGQWTFIAALPFYAGHPGNVTLSNEGTKPGTLTVFDQVRFTWSGTDCSVVGASPRHAEI
jgi:hypothetical protein